jgi:hypothetical protein
VLISVQKAVVVVARVDFLPAGSVGAVRGRGRVGLDEVGVEQQPREGLQRARI